jgi:NADH:ubiquinone oxidoreductase subunit F (NADH-binding)
LEQAIADAHDHGWLGEDIQGSGFSFGVELHRGAGAYICGEETALLESLEGRRGEPRVRPPYPTSHGYLGCPTVINNVETLCQVSAIVQQGAKWYRSRGTSESPGTKIFTVTGHINRPGAYEVPLGVTLRELIDRFAGGMRPGSSFKMALTGGAAGTVVPDSLLEVPIEYSSHNAGVAMGSGVVIVMDDSISAATLIDWLLHFFEMESCGKCTPCRAGTRQARIIAERLQLGQGRRGDCDQLAGLVKTLSTTSLCGLGQSVAWPVDSALKHFRTDFHEHIAD